MPPRLAETATYPMAFISSLTGHRLCTTAIMFQRTGAQAKAVWPKQYLYFPTTVGVGVSISSTAISLFGATTLSALDPGQNL